MTDKPSIPGTILTADLKGRRFMFSARQRAARAAEEAYDDWQCIEDPRRPLWDYVIDRALEALTDGEEDG